MAKEKVGTSALRVETEKNQVYVLVDGKLAIPPMPWDAARMIAKIIHDSSIIAEEYANANDMVTVQSKLIQMGIRIPVVNDPAIYREARKEAEWSKREKPNT